MANWLTPRLLADKSEVIKRKQTNHLFASHVYPLNKLVEKINKSEFGNDTVPWFDPSGAGINAKVLFLLQDPSNTALGTGFISPDNPDKTADYTSYFRNKANLRPEELIHWNIVPWAINKRNVETEIKKALNRPILGDKIKFSYLSTNDCPSILYQRVGKLVIDKKVNRDFVFGFMQTNYFFKELKKRLAGSDQPYINPTEFVNIIGFLPPRNLQDEFSLIFQKYMSLQKKIRESERQTEALFQYFLHQAFQGGMS